MSILLLKGRVLMFINKIRENYDINQPIFSEDILKLFPDYSRAYVFRLIKKAEDSGELAKFSTGVYYLPRKTFFGISTITADDVIRRRYISWNDDVYGIYSGLSLLNFFFVTTQVPNVLEVVTNNETTRVREISLDGRRFILRKSRFEINKDNENAYMILQLFSDLEKNEKVDEYAIERIIDFIQKNEITRKQLLSLSVYFPARAIKNMIRFGLLNEIA
ncbi:MAG: hypothetical protein J5666_04610 [Bacilli bacterium]|nr:hypothetical protein [Bacilli bacterium]